MRTPFGAVKPPILDLARVPRARGLEDEDLDFVVRRRPVFHAVRHDDELAGPDLDDTIAEFHAETAADAEEQLVLALVLVPEERALEFDQLDFLSVQLADDFRTPVLADQGQLLGDVYLVHRNAPGHRAASRR
jgi:hypothetical protein